MQYFENQTKIFLQSSFKVLRQLRWTGLQPNASVQPWKHGSFPFYTHPHSFPFQFPSWSHSHSNGIRIPSGNPVPTVISSSELEFSWVHFTGCDPCYRLRQWQIQKIVLEGANGLWGLCPQWGCRGRARTGSVERRSPQKLEYLMHSV